MGCFLLNASTSETVPIKADSPLGQTMSSKWKSPFIRTFRELFLSKMADSYIVRLKNIITCANSVRRQNPLWVVVHLPFIPFFRGAVTLGVFSFPGISSVHGIGFQNLILLHPIQPDNYYVKKEAPPNNSLQSSSITSNTCRQLSREAPSPPNASPRSRAAAAMSSR